ncbi:MAG: hypothetical protein Ta2E_01450 [Mycoplasmoidaceae bacterium]|nr:MAG: hypothetical protein Ta2E_01450 [Mycoplasmoidaceae bacterium]
MFGYHKRRSDDCYNVYLRNANDINFVNVLYGAQIRRMAKSIRYSYFDYCDKNNIRIFSYNTDSMLMKESDLDIWKQFISNENDKLKIGEQMKKIISLKVWGNLYCFWYKK